MRTPRAFTLVELIVVMAIIVLLTAVSVPAVNSVLESNQMTQGTRTLSGSLALARQTAFARNCPVVLRFYRYADPVRSGESVNTPSTGRYRAFQMFVDQGGARLTAMQKVVRLPSNVVINGGALSTVLSATAQNRTETTATASDPVVPGVGTKYIYQDLLVVPGGGMQLTVNPAPWSLTLMPARYPESLTTPPPNFSTFVLNPLNGIARLYRP